MRNKEMFKRIYIEITNKCNYNCEFCPKTKRKIRNMKEDEFEEILKKIQDYTEYIYLHVKGEPLIHDKLECFLKLAEKYGMKVIITTNGSLLKRRVDVLKNSNVIRQINISVHSLEQNKSLLFRGDEKENIKETEKYLNEIICAADEINEKNNCYISYRFWNLDRMQNLEKDAEMLEYIGEKYGIEHIAHKACKSSYIELGKNKYVNLDTIFEWPSINGKIISEIGSCYGLTQQIAILVDGTVVPCCLDQEGDISLGNIFNDNLKEILESDLAKKIVEGFKNNKIEHELCKRCGFRENKRR